MRRDEKKEFKVSLNPSLRGWSLISSGIRLHRISRIRDSRKIPECRSEALVEWSRVAYHDQVSSITQFFTISILIVDYLRDDYCEMKIKEKGLTGKSANHRRDLITSRKFNAFREMAKGKKKEAEEAKKDVYLDFLGHKLLIKEDEEGNGIISPEDIPYVKGVTLKFDGCGGDVTWSEIKACPSG